MDRCNMVVDRCSYKPGGGRCQRCSSNDSLGLRNCSKSGQTSLVQRYFNILRCRCRCFRCSLDRFFLFFSKFWHLFFFNDFRFFRCISDFKDFTVIVDRFSRCRCSRCLRVLVDHSGGEETAIRGLQRGIMI